MNLYGKGSDKRGYLVRFFGFARTVFLGVNGAGGVPSILRSTSSVLGVAGSRFLGSVFMVGV